MTKLQITKKLTAAGVPMTGVEVCTNEVEVYCTTKRGLYSPRLTNRRRRVVEQALGWRAGYLCGSGAWVVKESTLDMGEYNDKSSRWHY